MVVIVSLMANNPWVSGNYNALNFTVSIVFVNIVLSTIGKPAAFAEGLTSQTPKHTLSEHQKFMEFSKCLGNSQNFSEHGKCPKMSDSNVSFSMFGVLSWPNSGLSG
jgi:hypothetical protein